MKQVILIGTSHIAKQSMNVVEKTIREEKPDVVAVELDMMRFQALMNPDREQQKFSLYSIKAVGLKGFLFALIGSYISKKLGRLVGVDPGSDMLTAIKAAQANKIKIALIDQHINVTLSRFSRYFSWKERWNIVVDVFRGLVSPKKEIEKYGMQDFDLSKVPSEEIIEKALYMTKDRYPNLYKVLVHERNVYMVKRIIRMMKHDAISKLVVVVGAGHRKGMLTLLEDQPAAQFAIKVL